MIRLFSIVGGLLFVVNGATCQYQEISPGIEELSSVQHYEVDPNNNLLFASGQWNFLPDGTLNRDLVYYDGTQWLSIPGISDSLTGGRWGNFGDLYWKEDTLWYYRWFTDTLGIDNEVVGWITSLGSSWIRQEDTALMDDPPRAFFEFRDTLYLSGFFDTINGMPAHGLARREGNQWVGLTAPFPNPFGDYRGAFEDQGELYIYGNFNLSGGLNEIMKWDGAQTISSVGGNGVDGNFAIITDMARYQGEIYIAGGFNEQDGNEANNICKLINDQFVPIGRGLSTNSDGTGFTGPESLTLWNGYLVMTGNFSYADGLFSPNITLWDGVRFCRPVECFSTQGIRPAIVYNGDLAVSVNDWLPCNGDTLRHTALLPPGPPIACGPPVGLDETKDTEPSVQVFPNPSNGQFRVQVETPARLQVFDALGRQVLSQSVPAGTTAVDGSTLGSGLFFLSIQQEDGPVVTRRLVLQSP